MESKKTKLNPKQQIINAILGVIFEKDKFTLEEVKEAAYEVNEDKEWVLDILSDLYDVFISYYGIIDGVYYYYCPDILIGQSKKQSAKV